MTLTTNSIYTATVTLQENVACQYRFVNGNTASGLETVPATCGVLNGTGGYDRQVIVPDHDTIYNQVCFSMCGPCPASVNVTFRVNMQNQTVSPDGVHVAGTFNNWNYAQTLMTPVSGTIYEASMIMDEGTYMEFRYVNGLSSQQAEIVPSACALNGNRYFTVPAHDTVMTAYCFGECVVCGGVTHYTHVIFQVDMHTQPSVSPDGVHLAGTFQGWNTGATPMTVSGNKIFSYTDSLLTGTSVQYKYVNGNTAAGYETVPLACSSNGDRTFIVPANDTILRLVCFSSCDTCGPAIGTEEHAGSVISLSQNFPNPCSGITYIDYHVNGNGLLNLSVYSSLGKQVAVLFDGNCNPGSYKIQFNAHELPAGIYYCRMTFAGQAGAYIQSKMMIVQ
jgi:hypothetical protein